MAIKIQTLENISKTYRNRTYVYKDLTLDLTTTKIDSPGVSLPIPGSDIKASFDFLIQWKYYKRTIREFNKTVKYFKFSPVIKNVVASQ